MILLLNNGTKSQGLLVHQKGGKNLTNLFKPPQKSAQTEYFMEKEICCNEQSKEKN